MIDFPVQVSDKPKGIAVGAAKECVHTLSRVFLRSEKLSRAKNDDAGTVGADADLKKNREGEREEKRKKNGYTKRPYSIA